MQVDYEQGMNEINPLESFWVQYFMILLTESRGPD